MTNSKTMVKLTNKNGATFCGIRKYLAATSGEIANHLVVIGYGYEEANAHDLKILQAADAEAIAEAIGADIELARATIAKMIKSIVAPSKSHSDAQKDAYRHINSSMKIHLATGDLHIKALAVKKTVLQKRTKPYPKKGEVAQCQSDIAKHLGLRKDNIRQFKLENGTFALRGEVV